MNQLPMIFVLYIHICTTPIVTECHYMGVGEFEHEDECKEVGRDWSKSEIVNSFKCKLEMNTDFDLK